VKERESEAVWVGESGNTERSQSLYDPYSQTIRNVSTQQALLRSQLKSALDSVTLARRRDVSNSIRNMQERVEMSLSSAQGSERVTSPATSLPPATIRSPKTYLYDTHSKSLSPTWGGASVSQTTSPTIRSPVAPLPLASSADPENSDRHVKRLSSALLSLLDQEGRIASESVRGGGEGGGGGGGGDGKEGAPGKAWADMMTVLKRVADAGELLAATE
jgi:hypothetical protein